MKKIFFIAAATLALAACDKNDDNPVSSSFVAEISATIEDNSRAEDNKWDVDDVIGITATAGDKVAPQFNVKYTTIEGNGIFIGNPIYFYTNLIATAYYPFTGDEYVDPGIIEATTDKSNQSVENQPYIDFLWDSRTVDITTGVPILSFQFSHRMCKLTFIFENGNDGTDVSKITSYEISGLVLDGSFNTSTGDCAAKPSPQAPLSIPIPEGTVKHGEAVPSLIVFPQTVDTVTMKIKDNQNQDYTCNLNFTDNCLESGNNYTYTIIVKKTGLVLKQSGINEWADNTTDTDAVSE